MRLAYPVIEPALMADEWDSLVDQIELIAGVAKYAQIDVMDGRLVPPFSFPYNKTILDGQKLPHTNSISFGVHLMVQHPQEVGLRFIDAGVERVVAQIEGFREGEVERVCSEWRERGVEVGISIMLDTPLEHVTHLLDSGVASIVQVMSIAKIGYQGHAFDERSIARVRELRAKYPNVTIAVDGGVNEETLESLFNAGADMFGIGSAIMKTDDPSASFHKLRDLLNSYAQ